MAVRPPPHGWRCFLSLSTRGRCCCGWCCFEPAFASCVVLVSPPSFLVLLAFSLPLVRSAVSPSPPLCGAVFLPLPCGWCCLPSPSYIVVPPPCGAAAVLHQNWIEHRKHNTRRSESELIVFFLLINCCFFFVFLQLFFFFRFIFLLACWLLGRSKEGIQIKVDIPSGPRRPPNKPSKSRSPRSLPPPHTTPPTHTLHSSLHPHTLHSSLHHHSFLPPPRHTPHPLLLRPLLFGVFFFFGRPGWTGPYQDFKA